MNDDYKELLEQMINHVENGGGLYENDIHILGEIKKDIDRGNPEDMDRLEHIDDLVAKFKE